MSKFDRELARALMKRLPNRLDYVVSYRIEGAVELREMTTGHDRVVIMILSRTVDKFLTRKRMLKQSQQWSHRTVDVSPSEEAHRLMTKFDGCSNSS